MNQKREDLLKEMVKLYGIVCASEAVMNDKRRSASEKKEAEEKGTTAWYDWQRLNLGVVQRGREAEEALKKEEDEARIRELKAHVLAGEESTERMIQAMCPLFDANVEKETEEAHPIQHKYMTIQLKNCYGRTGHGKTFEAYSCCAYGLLEAIKKWDADKSNGARGIETYANHQIQRAIQEEYRQDQNPILKEQGWRKYDNYKNALKREDSGEVFVPDVQENSIESIDNAIEKLYLAAFARAYYDRRTDEIVDELYRLYQRRAELSRKQGINPHRKTKDDIREKIQDNLRDYDILEKIVQGKPKQVDPTGNNDFPDITDTRHKGMDEEIEGKTMEGSLDRVSYFLKRFWADQKRREHMYFYARPNTQRAPTQEERERIAKVVRLLIAGRYWDLSSKADVAVVTSIINFLINFYPSQRQLQQAIRELKVLIAEKNSDYIIG